MKSKLFHRIETDIFSLFFELLLHFILSYIIMLLCLYSSFVQNSAPHVRAPLYLIARVIESTSQ